MRERISAPMLPPGQSHRGGTWDGRGALRRLDATLGELRPWRPSRHAPELGHAAGSGGKEDDAYPFTCVSQDASGPSDEITTVRRLIEGNDEYWIELDDPSPAGDP